jgi:hypothetical protein
MADSDRTPAASPESGSSSPRPEAAPELQHPDNEATVEEASVTFRWTNVPEASNYELQIARDPDFENQLFEGRIGAESSFTFSGLPPQEGITLHWRVRAKRGEAWGPFSNPRRFTVADWRPEPPAFDGGGDEEGPAAPVQEKSQSRGEPILLVATIAVSVLALVLATLYFQNLNLTTAGSASAEGEANASSTDTTQAVDVPINEYEVDEERGVYRIPIDSAMKYVAEEAQQRADTSAQAQLP